MFIDRTLDASISTNASLVSLAPAAVPSLGVSRSTWSVAPRPRLFEAAVTVLALGLSFLMVAGALAEAIR